MNQLLSFIKKSFLWSYARNTWQWDVLCVLILIFIFLSPKSWFVSGEPHGPSGHQNATQSRVFVETEVVDSNKLEQRVRLLTKRPDAKIMSTSAVKDSTGKTVGYEVDIR